MWFSVCTFLATGGVSELDGFADLSSAAISVAKARNTRMEKHLFTGIIRKLSQKVRCKLYPNRKRQCFSESRLNHCSGPQLVAPILTHVERYCIRQEFLVGL